MKLRDEPKDPSTIIPSATNITPDTIQTAKWLKLTYEEVTNCLDYFQWIQIYSYLSFLFSVQVKPMQLEIITEV